MFVPIIRYAGFAIVLFAVSAFFVSVLELFEDQDVISKETEGLIRFIVCGAIVLFLAFLTLRAPFSAGLRTVILIGCMAVLAEYLLSYTEDIKALDDVPLIGGDCKVRRFLESALAAVSRLTLAYIAFRSILGMRSLYTEALRQERLRAIGEMTSGIAHDLNNALTPLIGSAELLAASTPGPSPAQAEHLRSLQQAAIDLSGIVERVSHFHSVSPGASRQTCSLAELIRESAEGIQPKLRAELDLNGSAIELRLNVTDANILVCPTEIRAVLTNLLFNSIQAMPGGGIISIASHIRNSDVTIEVTDTGKGMTADELNRCQEPFFTTKSAGSGLGLATCRQIIESYGAKLVLKSEPGLGTTAAFRLPMSEVIPLDTNSADVPDTPVSMRILLVEDEPMVQNAISMMLQHLGMSVACASDGEQAIHLLDEQIFDFVITDFGLPDVSGADLVQKIRMTHSGIGIAVLSGWSSESVMERCHADGVPDAILRKPASMNDLSTLLNNAVTSDALAQKNTSAVSEEQPQFALHNIARS